jgi:hypothetical protein
MDYIDEWATTAKPLTKLPAPSEHGGMNFLIPFVDVAVAVFQRSDAEQAVIDP